MTSNSKPRMSSKPSIRYKVSPVDGTSFKLDDFTDKGCPPSSSDSSRKLDKKLEPGCSEILSTPQLVSKVGKLWDRASRPLALLQPREKFRHNSGECTETSVLIHSRQSGDIGSSLSYEFGSQYLARNSVTSSHDLPVPPNDLYLMKASDKISLCGGQSWSYVHYVSRDSSISKGKSPTVLEISYELRERYRWMSVQSDPKRKAQMDFTSVENQMSENEPKEENCLGCSHCPANSLSKECADHTLDRTDVESNALGTQISGNCEDSQVYEDYELMDDSTPCPSEGRQEYAVLMTDDSENEVLSPTDSRSIYGLAKQEHAFAGALAGLSVSLCLHPVDTVKTVIQTYGSNQRSISYIGRSIISERGVMGLYRGIASNIASSAPISAVYAFTYESVKAFLLPMLPVEYQSLAHCTAGGCASIATSFIFTPSERIKQQMQVGSHYQNCWQAIVGIIRTGGVSSLYAGWGAVLCRNVPHSIIKFYTYENMKKLMSLSKEPTAHPNTSQTLLCGGLAGSTAALFTTPFDVVKTRLQTQIPGSVSRYDGVLNALVSIGKHEGLKGLYRGLIPRLFMYVSQGAIFFGSYESFKRLFFLEPS